MTVMTTGCRRRCARQMLPGCAGQFAMVWCRGIFLGDRLEVPAGVLGCVAGQPGIADPSCVRRCAGHRLVVPGLGERGGQKQPPCAVT
jgi:hypothetical protein